MGRIFLHSRLIQELHCQRRFESIRGPFRHWRTVGIRAIRISGFGEVRPVIAHLTGQVVVFTFKRTPAFSQCFKFKPEIGGMESAGVVAGYFRAETIAEDRLFSLVCQSLAKEVGRKLKEIYTGRLLQANTFRWRPFLLTKLQNSSAISGKLVLAQASMSSSGGTKRDSPVVEPIIIGTRF